MDTIQIIDNRKFSFERFRLLLRSDFIINRGNYFKFSLGILGIFVALAVLLSIPAINTINNIKETIDISSKQTIDYINNAISEFSFFYIIIGYWIISLGMTILGSLTFSCLSSRKKRVTTLMLPASMIEKYTLRLLTHFIGGTLLLVIGFLVGGLIIQATFKGGECIIGSINSLKVNSGSLLSEFWSNFYYLTLIVSAVLGNAVYTLGSAMWPKLSWVKTWIVLMTIEWILAIFLIMGLFSDFMLNGDMIQGISTDSIGIIMLIILSILTLFCWTAAWFRFRNTQIIQRFMIK